MKEKVDVSREKLVKEVEANINLYSIIMMAKDISNKEMVTGSTDEERKMFLTVANCVELLNPMDPKGNTIYFMETLPNAVPLYVPEGVMFVKTDNPQTMAMQMRLYADSWDNVNVDKLKEKQERERTTSGGSSTS